MDKLGRLWRASRSGLCFTELGDSNASCGAFFAEEISEGFATRGGARLGGTGEFSLDGIIDGLTGLLLVGAILGLILRDENAEYETADVVIPTVGPDTLSRVVGA